VLKIIMLAAALALGATLFSEPAQAANPRVKLDTNHGEIVLELFADKAPITTANFLDYVKSGHFNGTIFHRVMPGFMIQGGGFTTTMAPKPSGAPIRNEADNGLTNDKYTVAMARTSDPHSASSQFFINVADNAFLNHASKTPQGWGYAVFGKVVSGQEVVDKIALLPTEARGPHQNVPQTPAVIEKAELVEQ